MVDVIEFGDSRLPKRYWDKCEPEPNTGCWLWKGSIKTRAGSPHSYASYSHEGRIRLVGQVLADVFHEGYDKEKYRPVLDCGNHACGNPNHLRLKDKRECKRGHMKAENELNCLKCKAIREGGRPSTRAGRGTTGKSKYKPKEKAPEFQFSDPVRTEIWRPTGWPKEVLGGKLAGSFNDPARV